MAFPTSIGDPVGPFIRALLQSTAAEEEARQQRNRTLFEALTSFGQGVGRQRELRETREQAATEAEKGREHDIGMERLRQGGRAAEIAAAREEERRQLAYGRTPLDPRVFGDIVPADLQPARGFRLPTAEEQLKIREQRAKATADQPTALDIKNLELRGGTLELGEKKHALDVTREGRLKQAAEALKASREAQATYRQQYLDHLDRVATRLEDADTAGAELAALKEARHLLEQLGADVRSLESQATQIAGQIAGSMGTDITNALEQRQAELYENIAFLNAQKLPLQQRVGMIDAVDERVRDIVRFFVEQGITDPAAIEQRILAAEKESPSFAAWAKKYGRIGIAKILREVSR